MWFPLEQSRNNCVTFFGQTAFLTVVCYGTLCNLTQSNLSPRFPSFVCRIMLNLTVPAKASGWAKKRSRNCASGCTVKTSSSSKSTHTFPFRFPTLPSGVSKMVFMTTDFAGPAGSDSIYRNCIGWTDIMRSIRRIMRTNQRRRTRVSNSSFSNP
jgi:hypothetical protein